MSIVTRIKKAIEDIDRMLSYIYGTNNAIKGYASKIAQYTKKYAHKTSTGSVTVTPGSTLTVLDFSGWGALIWILCELSGVAKEKISVSADVDDAGGQGFAPFSWNPNWVHLNGFNSTGIYSFGTYSAVHRAWDTTNNVFKFYLIVKEQTFYDHYTLTIENKDTTNDLTAASNVLYYEYYASRRLKLLLNSYKGNIRQIHQKIKKDYKVHNAVYKFEKGKHVAELLLDDDVYDKKRDKLIEVLKREGLEIKDVL